MTTLSFFSEPIPRFKILFRTQSPESSHFSFLLSVLSARTLTHAIIVLLFFDIAPIPTPIRIRISSSRLAFKLLEHLLQERSGVFVRAAGFHGRGYLGPFFILVGAFDVDFGG